MSIKSFWTTNHLVNLRWDKYCNDNSFYLIVKSLCPIVLKSAFLTFLKMSRVTGIWMRLDHILIRGNSWSWRRCLSLSMSYRSCQWWTIIGSLTWRTLLLCLDHKMENHTGGWKSMTMTIRKVPFVYLSFWQKMCSNLV